MSDQFTEQDTERYYDEEDATYRAFWDSEGSLHWGYFDQSTGDDFLAASANLNKVMLERSGIDDQSIVLDLGCGNGNTSMWMAQQRACQITAIDLSGVRVESAAKSAKKLPAEVSARLKFEKASATALPYSGGQFSHVWSQATIYHVHDKQKVLSEVHRVLCDDGIFIFDDLTKPKPDVSAQAKKNVYDRLLFDTPYSFKGYQEALIAQGFKIEQAEDLSPHLGRSYQKLGELARAATADGRGDFTALADAYKYMVAAVDDGELGWATYVCRK